jgi:hypothetical protein
MRRLPTYLILMSALFLAFCSPTTVPVEPEPTPTVEIALSIGSDDWQAMEPPTISHSMGRITIVSRRLNNAIVEEFSLAMLDTISEGRHTLHADSAACAYFTLGGAADSTNMSHVRLYTGWLEITKPTASQIEGTFEAHFGYARKRGAGRFTAKLVH